MGATELMVDVSNPRHPSRAEAVKMLVDSGASWSVVPATMLRRLGIRPLRVDPLRRRRRPLRLRLG